METIEIVKLIAAIIIGFGAGIGFIYKRSMKVLDKMEQEMIDKYKPKKPEFPKFQTISFKNYDEAAKFMKDRGLPLPPIEFMNPSGTPNTPDEFNASKPLEVNDQNLPERQWYIKELMRLDATFKPSDSLETLKMIYGLLED